MKKIMWWCISGLLGIVSVTMPGEASAGYWWYFCCTADGPSGPLEYCGFSDVNDHAPVLSDAFQYWFSHDPPLTFDADTLSCSPADPFTLPPGDPVLYEDVELESSGRKEGSYECREIGADGLKVHVQNFWGDPDVWFKDPLFQYAEWHFNVFGTHMGIHGKVSCVYKGPVVWFPAAP